MKKRLVALILCFFLTFQINFFGYSQAVEAGEFIAGAVEFVSESQAFQFLCGLMGVTPSTAFVASAGGVAVAGTLMLQKFEQWVVEQAYPVNVAMWLSKLKSGVIDKKDECFSAFKSWISSLNASQSSSVLSDYQVLFTPNQVMEYFYSDGSPKTSFVTGVNIDVYFIPFYYGTTVVRMFYTDADASAPGFSNFYGDFRFRFDESDMSKDPSISSSYFTFYKDTNTTKYYPYHLSSCTDSKQGCISILSNADQVSSDFVFNPSLDGFLDGTKGAIDDIDLENVHNLPIGVQVDTGQISIAIDNVIDKLGSIESVLERIISGDLSIDKARQAADVVPVTKTKEGTISDVVTENEVIPVEEYVSNIEIIPPMPIPPSYDPNDYTVTGLQDVFPFCIPFDLIDFIGVLKADPETPVFVINCSFLGKKFDDLTFTIDLKPFDPLAKICRYSELFLFCVGLIIVTRNIIKG